jgi:hypothetical protein
MWQVSYVFKNCAFKEYVIAHEDLDISRRFLGRAKARKYTNIRWRKV